eukprot:gene672-2103_t
MGCINSKDDVKESVPALSSGCTEEAEEASPPREITLCSPTSDRLSGKLPPLSPSMASDRLSGKLPPLSPSMASDRLSGKLPALSPSMASDRLSGKLPPLSPSMASDRLSGKLPPQSPSKSSDRLSGKIQPLYPSSSSDRLSFTIQAHSAAKISESFDRLSGKNELLSDPSKISDRLSKEPSHTSPYMPSHLSTTVPQQYRSEVRSDLNLQHLIYSSANLHVVTGQFIELIKREGNDFLWAAAKSLQLWLVAVLSQKALQDLPTNGCSVSSFTTKGVT